MSFIDVEDKLIPKILDMWSSMSQSLYTKIIMNNKISLLVKFDIKSKIERLKKMKSFRCKIIEKVLTHKLYEY